MGRIFGISDVRVKTFESVWKPYVMPEPASVRIRRPKQLPVKNTTNMRDYEKHLYGSNTGRRWVKC